MDNLHKLSDATQQPILADYYRSKPVYAPSPEVANEEATARSSEPSETPPGGSAMDGFCRRYGYLWWTGSQTLFFRKRDWFVQASYEVPQDWLLETAAQLQARKGVPAYSDVFRIARLTTEQIAGLSSLSEAFEERDLSRARQQFRGCRELLAVWQVSPSVSAVAMPVSAVSDKGEKNRAVLSYETMTGSQRDRTGLFLDGRYTFGYAIPELDLALSPEKRESFETGLIAFADTTRLASDASTNNSLGRKSGIDIDLYWQMQGIGPVHRKLFLPLALPDDRRDRTRVELVP